MGFLGDIADIFGKFRFADLIDIIIIAAVIYLVVRVLRRMGSGQVLLGAIVVIAAAYALASVANLRVLKFILAKTTEIGVLALVIVFQPEIRRMLDKLGDKGTALTRLLRGESGLQDMEAAIEQVVDACADLSETRTGALIVFERDKPLDEHLSHAKFFDAELQPELLKTVFYEGTALHDGAMIIRNGRIAAAGCTVPLTEQKNLSSEYGHRHQAGIGVTEVSDALAVIVSEESGKITLTSMGKILIRIPAADHIPADLERHLKEIEKERELTEEETLRKNEELEKARNRTRNILRKKLKKELLPEEGDERWTKLRQWFRNRSKKDDADE